MNTKIKTRLLLAGIMAALCCSSANAQIIYSNYFTGIPSATNSVNGTAPTYASTNWVLGGTNTAVWTCSFSNSLTGFTNGVTGTVLVNGTIGTNNGCALLPFKPQTGHVYDINASVTIPASMGSDIDMGFAQYSGYQTNNIGFTRFNDSPPNGYAWIFMKTAANASFFGGAKTALGVNGATDLTPTAGTYTFDIVLSTLGTKWTAAAYVNGAQIGSTNIVYSSNPTIGSAGLGQPSFATTTTAGIQWNYWSLIATLQPFITTQPKSLSVSMNGDYTNVVGVTADPNGGTLSYQWYTNGVPLVNGGTISGVNSSILTINPVSTNNAGTNLYYVVVTNNYGAATSALSSLTILLNPAIAAQSPVTYTNPITLFGGTNVLGTNYLGSTPTFSITAAGAPPLFYQWRTNGVAVGGATNVSFTFANCQLSSPTNFACVVTNVFGAATNTWAAVYAVTPFAPYPQSVLAAQPAGFWRLNESPDDGSLYNAGVICNDYQSGDNGIYTNVTIAQLGYNSAEPAETSVQFSPAGSYNSYASQIQNVDFAVTNGGNAEFTVEAWAKSFGVPGGPVVIEGTYGSTEEFNLGVDTNNSGPYYQFYVRNAAGTVYNADSTFVAGDVAWHHLVGVCDEANGNLTLYVDGNVVATTNIPANSGLYETASSTAPATMSIGGQFKPASNPQFSGYADDVAVYRQALSAGQVVNQYVGALPGNTVSVYFAPSPPTNVIYQANQTLTIHATVSGSGPFGYYWTNLTTATVISSGGTSASGSLDATLNIPNASPSLSGDQLELFASNAIGSTNALVTLFNPAPPVTLSYNNPILYSNDFNGGTWSIAGMPMTVANSLVGGTNTTWVDALGTNDSGELLASGVSETTAQDSWIVPFTPHSGYVYTINAAVTFNGNPGNWVGLGFAQRVPTNAAIGYGRFTDAGTNPPDQGPNGYDWMILTESSGVVSYFQGPNTTTAVTNKTFASGLITHTMQIVLDTTGSNWVAYINVDGTFAGTNSYSATNLPPIGAVGITQNNPSTIGVVQWNYFALTQVAPGGVPPYLLAPLPSTNSILLTGALVVIPATAFGSATLGYYWKNNSTVIASGLTNNMAPLPAGLSVSSSSLSAGQLELVLTNAYGTNTTFIALLSSTLIPTNMPGITGFSLVGGNNVMINATNGQSGGTYYLLGTTNLLTPLSQWLPLATNVIVTNGGPANGFTFTGTNVVPVGNPQQFYILSNTNK